MKVTLTEIKERFDSLTGDVSYAKSFLDGTKRHFEKCYRIFDEIRKKTLPLDIQNLPEGSWSTSHWGTNGSMSVNLPSLRLELDFSDPNGGVNTMRRGLNALTGIVDRETIRSERLPYGHHRDQKVLWSGELPGAAIKEIVALHILMRSSHFRELREDLDGISYFVRLHSEILSERIFSKGKKDD